MSAKKSLFAEVPEHIPELIRELSYRERRTKREVIIEAIERYADAAKIKRPRAKSLTASA